MAEEERFELSDGFPSAVFKTASAARPPLRNGEQYKHPRLYCKALIVLFGVILNAL